MNRDAIVDLLTTDNTILTFTDVSLIWGKTNKEFVKKKIYRYIKAGKLYSLRKGIYSKGRVYDKYELATKIFTPAYISFETILISAGVVFQFYSPIMIASYLSREITCDGQKYTYHKIKDVILNNQNGIEKRNNYSIASPERAFLDVLYLHSEYHFDNLRPLNWNKILEILPTYCGNKRMTKMVNIYFKEFKNSQEQ